MSDPRTDLSEYAGTYGGYVQEELDDYKQTRLQSLAEAWINVAIGFGINFAANLLILPHFGFTSLTVGTNVLIGLVYTVISVVRSYVIRRWAQAHLKTATVRIATFLRKYL